MQYRTYYDVLQLLKQFDTYVHIGTRQLDIEFVAQEVDNMYKAGVIDAAQYANIKLVLRHEHELEVRQQSENKLS
ncbi:MAG: YqgQ family protein [Lactobacillaceae bacterium]|jgi:uncharacterized protein YqgQ|nr:YqgQ family protein [Lactobacillaceae bacterium]